MSATVACLSILPPNGIQLYMLKDLGGKDLLSIDMTQHIVGSFQFNPHRVLSGLSQINQHFSTFTANFLKKISKYIE